MPPKSFIEEWEIELPDGTIVKDEIEYSYVLSITGVSLTQTKNCRSIIGISGETEYMPVPENFEENRIELGALVQKWSAWKDEEKVQSENRGSRYLSYASWLEENLKDSTMTTLLMTFASKT